MNYPKNIEDKIGFNIIREHLKELCLSELGKQLIQELEYSHNTKHIDESLQLIKEMRQILELEENYPTPSFNHINNSLQSIQPSETFLQTKELHILKKSLLEISQLIHYLTQKKEVFPILYNSCLHVYIPLEVCKCIEQVVDNTGQLKNNASKQLAEIRGTIQAHKQRVNKVMQQKLQLARTEGWLDSDSELTIRNNRLVLPVTTAYKRKIQGFVHDESITGKTSYLEPVEAFEINNEIASLEFEEQKEIIRILKQVANEIRPHIHDISVAYSYLAFIDSIQAKALFAKRLQANPPKISNKREISLFNARHPLLVLSFEKSGKTIVPMRVELSNSQRILVISGPNAGGKSVCLKSIVLLQYMFQCGLHIPADEHSCLGVFSSIFIDIGDEQSIENDLSTYSSHLRNMQYMLKFSDSRTLFCIDEFGTGTEPLLGGAIAESVLEGLHDTGAFGIITTHYTNLKHTANILQYAINGAMLFDVTNMKPLYKLRLGSAGSSFAFEIATEIGLPSHVLERAKEKIGKDHVNFDRDLKKLEEEKQFIFKKKANILKREEEIKTLQAELVAKNQKINDQKNNIISETKSTVENIIKTANKQIEQTIREIKENQANKQKTLEARALLKDNQEKLQKSLSNTPKTPVKAPQNNSKQPITIGSYVQVEGQTTIGEVVSITNKQAKVQFSHACITIDLQKLIVTKKPKPTSSSTIVRSTTQTISKKRIDFSPKLDIRGNRGEEALYAVKDFVETAYVLQIQKIEILHGKGYGILRKLIRDYLLSNPIVKQCYDAPLDLGGDGITIIELDT